MGCLHDPANVQQTSSKCIQNTRANAGRLLDRVKHPITDQDTRPIISTLFSALIYWLLRRGHTSGPDGRPEEACIVALD